MDDARPLEYVADPQEIQRLNDSPAWAVICKAPSVAIVVTKPGHYGNSRVMARRANAKDERDNVEPFYELEQAKEWLASRRS